MTAEQFTYWLQGCMEIADPTRLGERETQMIKDHLKLVFDKQTPDRAPGSIDPTTTIPSPMAHTSINTIPTTPYPIWQDPNPYKITCDTSPYTDNGENPMERIYCSHMVPQDMFGTKEDKIGTDSLKVIKEEKRKFRGGVKC